MSEFLLELYSEEIPPLLQINAREHLKDELQKLMNKHRIKYKKSLNYSCPTRVLIAFDGLPEKIKIQSQEIKGPRVGVSEDIIHKFSKSHNISYKDLIKKKKNGKRRILFFKNR